MQILNRPATPLEKLWIAYERVFPLSYEMYPYLKLEGGIDEKLLRESYIKTLNAFPHLKRKLVFVGEKNFYWSLEPEVPEDSFEFITVKGKKQTFLKIYQDIINHPRFDLSRQLGVKIYLVRESEKTDFIVFRFSHVVMDWGGGSSFLEELSQCYNALDQGKEPVFSHIMEQPFDDFFAREAKKVRFRDFLKFLAIAFERFIPFSPKQWFTWQNTTGEK